MYGNQKRTAAMGSDSITPVSHKPQLSSARFDSAKNEKLEKRKLLVGREGGTDERVVVPIRESPSMFVSCIRLTDCI